MSIGIRFTEPSFQHYSPYWLYFPSFAVVLVGLVVYFWYAAPEDQGKVDPQAPAYVHRRGDTRATPGGLDDVERGVDFDVRKD